MQRDTDGNGKGDVCDKKSMYNFSNGSSQIYIIFSEDDNQATYATLDKYAQAIIAFMDMQGYHIDLYAFSPVSTSGWTSGPGLNYDNQPPYPGNYSTSAQLSITDPDGNWEIMAYSNYTVNLSVRNGKTLYLNHRQSVSNSWGAGGPWTSYKIIPDFCINAQGDIAIRYRDNAASGCGYGWCIKYYKECMNWSSGSWFDVGSLTGGSNSNGPYTSSNNNIYDEYISFISYTENPYLEVGTPDSIYEWNYTGVFNLTGSTRYYYSRTSNFASALNFALNNGSCDCEGCTLEGINCTIPLMFHSNTPGKIMAFNLNITYWPDSEGDGVADYQDNCPLDNNPAQEDVDSDEYGDVCDICPQDSNNDRDNDTVCGNIDNCRSVYNPNQSDSDGDGYGNACDNCPIVENQGQDDYDNDGIGNVCDTNAPLTIKIDMQGRLNDSTNATIELKKGGLCMLINLSTNYYGEAIINDVEYGIYNLTAKPVYYLRNAVYSSEVNVYGGDSNFGASKGGDFNKDNKVSSQDIAGFSSAYGSNCTSSYYKWQADFNGDCKVNSQDIAGFSSAYGSAGVQSLC